MKPVAQSTGLRHWMHRVLEECDRVATDFSADPVHDLRVALRRCRSMADGLLAIDPDPQWKAMKKAGGVLFRSLGALRDVHVMMEWIEELHPRDAKSTPVLGSQESLPGGMTPDLPVAGGQPSNVQSAPSVPSSTPAAHALLHILREREHRHKQEAKAALDDFDRKQWRKWSSSLPNRAGRFRLGSPLFKHLALERWTEARKLHDRALRNRSQTALHELRIGIKRFRYIVENFLPAEHTAWSNDLKKIQDLLGEIHDLDVLMSTAVEAQVFRDEEEKRSWRARIQDERTSRVEQYRKRMVGPDSLWYVWRAALPLGKQIREIATRRIKLWAAALDPDFPHSERVATFAVQLYDSLQAAGLISSDGPDGERQCLQIAAFLHDVGKSKRENKHHKASAKLITRHGVPLGWSSKVMGQAALVARFHQGALPRKSHKLLRDLLPDEQKTVIRLSAILRLANACDAAHDGQIRDLRLDPLARPRRVNGFVQKAASLHEPVIIAAAGYVATNATARAIAGERHLLETILRRPVLIKPAKM